MQYTDAQLEQLFSNDGLDGFRIWQREDGMYEPLYTVGQYVIWRSYFRTTRWAKERVTRGGGRQYDSEQIVYKSRAAAIRFIAEKHEQAKRLRSM